MPGGLATADRRDVHDRPATARGDPLPGEGLRHRECANHVDLKDAAVGLWGQLGDTAVHREDARVVHEYVDAAGGLELGEQCGDGRRISDVELCCGRAESQGGLLCGRGVAVRENDAIARVGECLAEALADASGPASNENGACCGHGDSNVWVCSGVPGLEPARFILYDRRK